MQIGATWHSNWIWRLEQLLQRLKRSIINIHHLHKINHYSWWFHIKKRYVHPEPWGFMESNLTFANISQIWWVKNQQRWISKDTVWWKPEAFEHDRFAVGPSYNFFSPQKTPESLKLESRIQSLQKDPEGSSTLGMNGDSLHHIKGTWRQLVWFYA